MHILVTARVVRAYDIDLTDAGSNRNISGKGNAQKKIPAYIVRVPAKSRNLTDGCKRNPELLGILPHGFTCIEVITFDICNIFLTQAQNLGLLSRVLCSSLLFDFPSLFYLG